jgi:energy-coupling factor transport system ATP-binding protein
MIEIEHVSYRYPKNSADTLHDVNLHFERGEICALTGKNGCGKTTLTKLLTGILRPDKGDILVNETDIKNCNLFEIGQQIGYVFQNPNKQLFCATVFEEIAFGLRNKNMPPSDVKRLTEEYLERFHLEKLHNKYPGNLSYGEKQRVVLAAVLALGTDYLVLDEPTTGLDMRGRSELGGILKKLSIEQGCGIVIVSHERGFVERYANREAVLV